jgi:hypothetical protein
MISCIIMSVKLITYDLDKPGQDYTDLLKEIKSFSWARLSESSYAVDTDLSPSQLYDRLSPYTDANDTIYVIPLHSPYRGFGPKEVNDWLERHLKYAQVLA